MATENSNPDNQPDPDTAPDNDEEAPDSNTDEPVGEKEIDIDQIIEDADVPEDQDAENGDAGAGEDGFRTAINNAFGRILTLDLDPGNEETDRLRRQLQGLAEDVRLGHNANRFLQKYVMTKGEPDPKTALFGSTVAALALALAIRPELPSKLKAQVLDHDTGDQS